MAIKPLVSSIQFRPDTRNVVGFRTNLPAVDLPGVRQLARNLEGAGVQMAKESAERDAKERAYSVSLERDANGNLVMPEAPENWGQYRKDIFNDLVRKRYVDGVTSDAKTKIADIYAKNLYNPLEAKQLADEHVESVKKTLPPVARGVIEDEARKTSNQYYNANTRRNAITADNDARNFAVNSYKSALQNYATAVSVGDEDGAKKYADEMARLAPQMKLGPEALANTVKTIENVKKVAKFEFQINKFLSDSSISLPEKARLIQDAQRSLEEKPDPDSEVKIFGMSHKELWAMEPIDRERLKKYLKKQIASVRKGYVESTGLTKNQITILGNISGSTDVSPYKIPLDTSPKDVTAVVKHIAKTTGTSEVATLGLLAEKHNAGYFVINYFNKARAAAMGKPEDMEKLSQTYNQLIAMKSTAPFAKELIKGTSTDIRFLRAYLSSPSTDPIVKYKQAEEMVSPYREAVTISGISSSIAKGRGIKISDVDDSLSKAFGAKDFAKLSVNAKKNLYDSMLTASIGSEKVTLENVAKEAVAIFKKDWIKYDGALKGQIRKEGGLPFVNNNGTPDFSYLNSMVPSLRKYVKKDKDGKLIMGDGVKPVDSEKLQFGKNLFVQKERNQVWTVWYKPMDASGRLTPVLVNGQKEILQINPAKIVAKENLARKQATLNNQMDIANRSVLQSYPIISPIARSITGLFSMPKIKPTETAPSIKIQTQPSLMDPISEGISRDIKSPYSSEFYSRTMPVDASEVFVGSSGNLIPEGGKIPPNRSPTKVNKSDLMSRPKHTLRATPLDIIKKEK